MMDFDIFALNRLKKADRKWVEEWNDYDHRI